MPFNKKIYAPKLFKLFYVIKKGERRKDCDVRFKLLSLLFFLLYINSFPDSDFYPTPNSMVVPDYDIAVFPESERPLNFIILGNDTRDFISLKNNSLKANKHYREIKKELWMLCFELEHGRIINSIPSYTKIYFAITENEEKDFFIEYLIKKCGFKKEDVKKRIVFFNIPSPCLWMQDTGEIAGRDESGNIFIINNPEDPYSFVLNNLIKKDLKIFKLKTFQLSSVEGGDIEIAWNVNRKGVSVFIGRHRVLEYLNRVEGIDYKDRAILPDKINNIKNLYSEVFFNLPVKIIPEKVLLQPSLAENELFHLDMVVTFLANENKIFAFVPFYEKEQGNFDVVLRKPLDPFFIKKLNKEYNAVAEQLKNLNYEVIRIPIFDHPVRSPVNIIKFIDKENGKQKILLGKYPYYNISLPVENSPYSRIDKSLALLENSLRQFEQSPSDINYESFLADVNYVWKTIASEYLSSNPNFEKQKKVYENCGFKVIEVPILASGSGGLHCTALY